MNRKPTKYPVFFAVIALVCLTAGIVSAAIVTDSITYQGKLTDAAGNPLTGNYNLTFRIYPSGTGGTFLSTDTHSVTATNGLFTTPIAVADPSVVDGRRLWLGVAAGSDPEMTPRQEVRPVPYALSLRPGAFIAEANFLTFYGGTSVNNLLAAVNVSTISAFNPGVRINTTGANSAGVYASTAGPNSVGIRAKTEGDHSYGMDVTTSGSGSGGVYATTLGFESTGVKAVTFGDGSNGVDVHTFGPLSNGIYAETDYKNSHGVYAETHGDKSGGVIANTTGDYSNGLSANTSGMYSTGLVAYTTGTRSPGIVAHTEGSQSNGIRVRTAQSSSSGMDVLTEGSGSNGIGIETTGDNSDGVEIETEGTGSDGAYIMAMGDNSNGVEAWAAGFRSYGIYAHSAQFDAIYATTMNESYYGLRTPNKIRANGVDLPTSDVAEFMPVAEDVEPGTVLIIGPDGKLRQSADAYDTRVAGIVSTSPGVSLGTKEEGNSGEEIIAVAGRVPCRADATYGVIRPGDVLTTSPTPGHAMKAVPVNVGGVEIYRPSTVLGKAMGSLDSGTGTIEVLVTLQ